MPSPYLSRRRLLPLSLLLVFPPCASLAAVLQWDSDGAFPPLEGDPAFGKIVDGSGSWDLVTPNWSVDSGATNIMWNNAVAPEAPHDVIFGNGGEFSGTVTNAMAANLPVSVGNITFAQMATTDAIYTVVGRIEFRKSLPLSEITLNQDAVIDSITSGLGYVKKGPGSLLLRSSQTTSITFNPTLDVTFDIQEGVVELGPTGASNSRGHFREGVVRIASGAKVRLLSPQRIQDDRSVVRIEEGGEFDLNGQLGTGASNTLATLTGVAFQGAEKFGYLEGNGSFRPGAENFMLHYGGGAETHTFGGVIGGSGNVWVDAANIKSYSVQELTGENTFTGQLGVYTGTLAFQKASSLGLSAGIINMGTAISGDNPVHGVLRYTGVEPLAFSRPLHLYAGGTATSPVSPGTLLGGGGFEASGATGAAVTFTSLITSANGDKPFILGGTNSDANEFGSSLADVVVDDGINPPVRYAASLQKHGPGTWHLTQPGAFTGGVEMNDGTLHLDNAGALNSEPGLENSLRLHSGTFMLNGNSLILGNGTATGWGLAGAGGTIRNAAAAPVTLTVRNNAAQSQVFRGSLSDAGGGAITLVKQGTGTTSLSSKAHNYSGSTTVEAGTLRTESVSATLPVSGAQWHLDASDASTITESAGAVSAWRNKASNTRHLSLPVPVVANVPVTNPTYVPAAINGLNAVRFNGVSDVLGSTTAATAATVFIVCSNATNGDATLKGGGIIGGNGLSGVPSQTGIRGPRGGVWFGAGEGTDIARPYGSEFRVNGALTTRVTPVGDNYWHTMTAVRGSGTVSYNSVGGFPSLQAGGDNYWFRGDIGEIIVYPTALSAENRAKVEAYLQQKWFGGTVSSNLLPVTTPVTVAPAATLDSGVPQTVASLDLSGSLKLGAPAGELVVSGTATLQGGSTLNWDVTNWTGTAGAGYDVLSAGTLAIAATAEAPLTVKIAQPALTGYAPGSRTFTLARATTALTGFDAAKFTLDTTGFTAGTGAWSIVKTGNTLELKYEESATPYDLWIATFGLSPADAAASADPDGDGWANVLEFAVNGHPANRSVSAAVTERIASVGAEDAFTITVPVRSGVTLSGAAALTGSVDGVTYFFEGSDDLSAWALDIDEVTPALSAGLPALPTGWEYRSFRAPGPVTADAADFMRVRVQAP